MERLLTHHQTRNCQRRFAAKFEFVALLLLYSSKPACARKIPWVLCTPRGKLFKRKLHAEQDPDQDIGGDDGSHGEGDADLEEVAVGNIVTFLAQDADAGNIGRSTDGS